MFGFPVDENLHDKVDATEMPVAPRVITLEVDKADIEIQLTDNSDSYFDVQSTVRGFGLPTNTVKTSIEHAMQPTAQINYRLTHEGIYSELDSVVKVRLAANNLERLVVHVQQGDITVNRESRVTRMPLLELSTAHGRVIKPAENP